MSRKSIVCGRSFQRTNKIRNTSAFIQRVFALQILYRTFCRTRVARRPTQCAPHHHALLSIGVEHKVRFFTQGAARYFQFKSLTLIVFDCIKACYILD